MMNEYQIHIRGQSLEDQILDYARMNDCLPELCDLVDYHPAVGRVQEHWEPKVYVLGLVREILISRS